MGISGTATAGVTAARTQRTEASVPLGRCTESELTSAAAPLVPGPAPLDLPHALVDWVAMLIVTRQGGQPHDVSRQGRLRPEEATLRMFTDYQQARAALGRGCGHSVSRAVVVGSPVGGSRSGSAGRAPLSKLEHGRQTATHEGLEGLRAWADATGHPGRPRNSTSAYGHNAEPRTATSSRRRGGHGWRPGGARRGGRRR